MKKRLMCLVLCLFLTLPMILASCSEDDDENDGPDLNTIVLAMIQGEKTTQAGVDAVERALNDIVEPMYGINIEVQVYPEEEYFGIIRNKLLATAKEVEEAENEAEAEKDRLESMNAANGNKPEKETEAESQTEPATWLDEEGNPHYVYPEAGENQVDIFLVTDIAEYYELIKDPAGVRLWNMTERLGEQHKGLRKIINTNFFNAVTVDGAVYGIPNNHIVEEYTYLLLNKDICTEQLYWKGDEITTLKDLDMYLEAVDTYLPEAKKLYNLPGEQMRHFTENFSFFGTYYGTAVDPQVGNPPRGNALSNAAFKEYLTACYNYRKDGWVTEGNTNAIPEGETYAAAFLTGGTDIVEKYSDEYHVITYAKPVASSFDLFKGVFCVSAYSELPETCMDIIAMLSTDAELRNALQYGRSGITYTENEETGVITPMTEGEAIWDPDPLHTGNQFLLKPSTLMTEKEQIFAANNWTVGKTINAGMELDYYAQIPFRYITEDTLITRYQAIIDFAPYEGYDKDDLPEFIKVDAEGNVLTTQEEYIAAYTSTYTYTRELMREIEEYSAKVMERIKSFEEKPDKDGKIITFEEFLKDLEVEVSGNKAMIEAAQPSNQDSLLTQYANSRTGALVWE